MHAQAIGVVQQFFDADLTDSSVQQVADVGLVLVKDVDERALGEAAAVNLGEDGFKDGGLDLQGGGLGPGKAEVVEDVALGDVGRFGHVENHSLAALEFAQSLLDQAQSRFRRFKVALVCLSTVFLKAMQYVNDAVDAREIHDAVPSAFVAFFQLPHTLAHGGHGAVAAKRKPAILNLPQRETERRFHVAGKLAEDFLRIPFPGDVCRPGVVRGFHVKLII